jgi:hypothetical protein
LGGIGNLLLQQLYESGGREMIAFVGMRSAMYEVDKEVSQHI